MRVLVVEDEKKTASFVRKALQTESFAVDIVANGTDALIAAASTPFDVIVLDIMLPGRDGLSVLRQLRERQNTTPVLLLSARGEVNERVEGLNAGADDYLPKPFELAELVARVRALTRRGGENKSSVLCVADLKLNTVTHKARRSETEIELTVAGIIKSFGTDINDKTIDYGSMVEEGAVLAKIDDSVYAADLSVAKAGELSATANLEQMQAKLDQAEAEWKRAQELYNSKLLSGVDYDTDKANYEIAKANVSVANSGIAQAKADLEKSQRNLDFCIIKSPVRGVIIDRRVNIGQTVVSSFNAPSLFLIAKDLTKMQIWVAVNEADIGRIVPGAPVTFACDAFPGRQFEGMVGKVRPNAAMTQNVVMFTVEVNMDNSDKVLLPYLTANVHFVVRKESDVLLVPNAALRWSPSSLTQISPDARSHNPADPPSDDKKKQQGSKQPVGTVWLKIGEYVRPVEVKIGTTDGANTAVVADDLKEGQEVVVGTSSGPQASTLNPFLPPVIRR